MSKEFIRNLLLLAIVLIFVSPALAWDSVGHKLSAYIAWQQMTPATRERVMKIMLNAPEDSDLSVFYPQDARSEAARQQEFFMIAAYWSDIVRDRKLKNRADKYHHSNWHYADTFWTIENGQLKILEKPDEDGGKAVEKLFDFEKVLKSPNASDADKAIAIAWVLHLGGDIHQPLHTSARVTEFEPKGDQGGNTFLLTPKDTPREQQQNLHSFWDRIIGINIPRVNDSPDVIYLPQIGTKIMKKYPFSKMQNRMNLGKFDEWQQESFKIATTELFPPTLIRFQKPTATYQKQAFNIAEQQIALAGYRLGATLNQIFGNQPVAETNLPQPMSCNIIRTVLYPVTKINNPQNPQKNRICLLDVCPPNKGMVARPMLAFMIDGKTIWREYDVVKVFENADEAKKYAKENNISDVSF